MHLPLEHHFTKMLRLKKQIKVKVKELKRYKWRARRRLRRMRKMRAWLLNKMQRFVSTKHTDLQRAKKQRTLRSVKRMLLIYKAWLRKCHRSLRLQRKSIEKKKRQERQLDRKLRLLRKRLKRKFGKSHDSEDYFRKISQTIQNWNKYAALKLHRGTLHQLKENSKKLQTQIMQVSNYTNALQAASKRGLHHKKSKSSISQLTTFWRSNAHRRKIRKPKLPTESYVPEPTVSKSRKIKRQTKRVRKKKNSAKLNILYEAFQELQWPFKKKLRSRGKRLERQKSSKMGKDITMETGEAAAQESTTKTYKRKKRKKIGKSVSWGDMTISATAKPVVTNVRYVKIKPKIKSAMKRKSETSPLKSDQIGLTESAFFVDDLKKSKRIAEQSLVALEEAASPISENDMDDEERKYLAAIREVRKLARKMTKPPVHKISNLAMGPSRTIKAKEEKQPKTRGQILSKKRTAGETDSKESVREGLKTSGKKKTKTREKDSNKKRTIADTDSKVLERKKIKSSAPTDETDEPKKKKKKSVAWKGEFRKSRADVDSYNSSVYKYMKTKIKNEVTTGKKKGARSTGVRQSARETGSSRSARSNKSTRSSPSTRSTKSTRTSLSGRTTGVSQSSMTRGARGVEGKKKSILKKRRASTDETILTGSTDRSDRPEPRISTVSPRIDSSSKTAEAKPKSKRERKSVLPKAGQSLLSRLHAYRRDMSTISALEPNLDNLDIPQYSMDHESMSLKKPAAHYDLHKKGKKMGKEPDLPHDSHYPIKKTEKPDAQEDLQNQNKGARHEPTEEVSTDNTEKEELINITYNNLESETAINIQKYDDHIAKSDEVLPKIQLGENKKRLKKKFKDVVRHISLDARQMGRSIIDNAASKLERIKVPKEEEKEKAREISKIETVAKLQLTDPMAYDIYSVPIKLGEKDKKKQEEKKEEKKKKAKLPEMLISPDKEKAKRLFDMIVSKDIPTTETDLELLDRYLHENHGESMLKTYFDQLVYEDQEKYELERQRRRAERKRRRKYMYESHTDLLAASSSSRLFDVESVFQLNPAEEQDIYDIELRYANERMEKIKEDWAKYFEAMKRYKERKALKSSSDQLHEPHPITSRHISTEELQRQTDQRKRMKRKSKQKKKVRFRPLSQLYYAPRMTSRMRKIEHSDIDDSDESDDSEDFEFFEYDLHAPKKRKKRKRRSLDESLKTEHCPRCGIKVASVPASRKQPSHSPSRISLTASTIAACAKSEWLKQVLADICGQCGYVHEKHKPCPQVSLLVPGIAKGPLQRINAAAAVNQSACSTSALPEPDATSNTTSCQSATCSTCGLLRVEHPAPAQTKSSSSTNSFKHGHNIVMCAQRGFNALCVPLRICSHCGLTQCSSACKVFAQNQRFK